MISMMPDLHIPSNRAELLGSGDVLSSKSDINVFLSIYLQILLTLISNVLLMSFFSFSM